MMNDRNQIKFICGLINKANTILPELFNEYLKETTNSEYPYVDVLIKDKKIMIFVELPGLNLDDFIVCQFEDLLIIQGKFKTYLDDKIKFLQIERKFNFFRKIINLPFCNMISTQAKLKDGVLYLEFV